MTPLRPFSLGTLALNARILKSSLGWSVQVDFVIQLSSHRSLAEQVRNQDYIEKVKQIRHDIRSPLSSIQSAYELLNKNDKPSQAIATAIRRIQILIDDLNEVNKLHEKSKLIIAEINLEETVLILSSKFKSQKNADLIFEYDDSSLTPINVREKDFTSVIENLLENPLEAIDQNGQVSIKIESQNRNCIITIADNGCGVAPDNISSLFSKGATFGKANGIGLGLFNAKKVIESFGGTINYVAIESGAKFASWGQKQNRFLQRLYL